MPLYEVSTWHHGHWWWCARMEIESLLPDILPRKMGSRTTRNPHHPTHLCYDYQLRFSQGNFTSSGGKPLPPLQLLYHPVWVIVNLHPEEIFAIHRCQEHNGIIMLFNDTGLVLVHKVREPVFCFLRDWFDFDCFHCDDLVEMNLV